MLSTCSTCSIRGIPSNIQLTGRFYPVVDIEYPDIANWERFFVRSSSRTVVSLIARPLSKQSSSLSPSVRPLELDPKELILNRTPARALPVSVTSNGGYLPSFV